MTKNQQIVKRVMGLFKQFCAEYASARRTDRYIVPMPDKAYLDMMGAKVLWPAYLREQAPDLF